MAGVPRLNSDMSVTVTAENGSVAHVLPAEALAGGGIGYFYERLVGLHYERAGYRVEYRSHLAFLDKGVDLVASSASERRFIQCKFTRRSIGVAKVERLLYGASTFVRDNLGLGKHHFDLVVPSRAIAFPEGCRAERAFTRYNASQHHVRLNIVEVPMEGAPIEMKTRA